MTADEKRKEYHRKYRAKNKIKIAEQNKLYREKNAEAIEERRAAYRASNRKKIRITNNCNYKNKPEIWILSNIKKRCKDRGLPFDLTVEDLAMPEFCPVLGLRLERNHGGRKGGPKPNSPAVDRVIPSLGYVKSNILIVSHLANCIKQNATPRQIRLVADFYEKLTDGCPRV